MEITLVYQLFKFIKADKSLDNFDENYKRVLFAILLSLFPGLGQVYTGNLFRGIISYLGLIILSWLCAILYLYIESRVLSMLVLCLPFIYVLSVCIDAAFCAIRTDTNRSISSKQTLGFHIIIFITLFIFFINIMDYLIGKHIVRAYFVTTNSMTPSIYQFDLILVDKLSKPKEGDVVLLEFSNNSKKSSISNIIKGQTLRRIIATEGDTIEMRGQLLYKNNILFNENYAHYGESDSHNIYTSKDFRWGPDVIPESTYFVLSDSRQYGFDSRTFGFISDKYIRGVASKVLWSWNLDNGSFQWGRTALRIK